MNAQDQLRQAAEQFVASCKDGNAAELLEYYEDIFKEALAAVGPSPQWWQKLELLMTKWQMAPPGPDAHNAHVDIREHFSVIGMHWPDDAFGVDAPAPAAPTRLWLWRNFVDGKPEYWAFDNPYPCESVGGDPLTLGEPCGWAILKPSVNGRPNRPEQEVIDGAIRRAGNAGVGEQK